MDEVLSSGSAHLRHAQVPHVLLDRQVPDETACRQDDEAIFKRQRPEFADADPQPRHHKDEGDDGADIPRYLEMESVSLIHGPQSRLEINARDCTYHLTTTLCHCDSNGADVDAAWGNVVLVLSYFLIYIPVAVFCPARDPLGLLCPGTTSRGFAAVHT